jgi:hypothetical protein
MNFEKHKLIKTVLASAIAISLTACDTEDSGDTSNTGQSNNPDISTPTYNSDFIVFNDGENEYWPAFDSSNATTPTIVNIGGDYGAVVEFTPSELNSTEEDNAVFGFIRSESNSALDASAYSDNGVLKFDLRLVNAPVADDVTWLVKFESNGGIYDEDTTQGEEAEIAISAPVLGVWQEVTINMPDLLNLGLDLANVDKIIISPAWGKAEGIKFQVDNVKFYIDGYVAPPESDVPTAILPTNENADTGDKLNINVGGASDFGGAVTTIIEQNGETFNQTLKPATAESWAGTTILDSEALAFENGRTKMSVWIYSPEASVPVVLKVENDSNPAINVLAQAHTTVAEEWEKLTFDFSMPLEGALDLAATYDKKSLFLNYLVSSASPLTFFWDDMTLIEGEEVVITPPEEVEEEIITLFNDVANPQWAAWDCCGGSTPTVVVDSDDTYGATTEFTINGATVVGFTSRSTDGHTAVNGETLDLSAWQQTGVFSFDLKLTNDAGASDWKFKIESAAGGALETSLPELPVLDEWKHYTFNLSDIATGGVNLSAVDLVMMFPAWGSGIGSTFLVDNVEFSSVGNTPVEIEPDEPLDPVTVVGNLITNGDFENGIDSWSASSETVTSSTGAVRLLAGDAQTIEAKQTLIGETELSQGDSITLTFSVKGTTADGGVANVILHTMEPTLGATDTDILPFALTESWVEHSFNIDIDQPTGWGVDLTLNATCGAVMTCSSDVKFDNVSIVKN